MHRAHLSVVPFLYFFIFPSSLSLFVCLPLRSIRCASPCPLLEREPSQTLQECTPEEQKEMKATEMGAPAGPYTSLSFSSYGCFRVGRGGMSSWALFFSSAFSHVRSSAQSLVFFLYLSEKNAISFFAVSVVLFSLFLFRIPLYSPSAFFVFFF